MNDRKRILHANINNQGGAFSLIYQAQIELQDRFVFDYFSSNEFIDNEVYKKLQKMGSKCTGGINSRNRFFRQYKIYQTFRAYLMENLYDFVHIHADTAWKISIYYLAAKKAGIKNIIVHSHSSGINGHFRLINYILHVLMRPCVKKAKYKCACSKMAARWMYQTEKNVNLIQNGVDVDKYKFDLSNRINIRNNYKIKDDQIVIGTVSDFSYPKNPEYIYRIITQLGASMDYVFFLVGDGPGKNKLEEKIYKSGLQDKTIFIGMVTNVEAYLSAMDIFILPSRFEGLPICALEAQVSGLYTIISDKVTPETKFSKYFESIEFDIDKWINQIKKVKLGYDRSNQKDYLISERMKITETANQLELLYNQER